MPTYDTGNQKKATVPENVRSMDNCLNNIVPDESSVLLMNREGDRSTRSIRLTLLPRLAHLLTLNIRKFAYS
jgi:hypothetical protein